MQWEGKFMKKNRLVVRTVILAILITAIGYTFYINFFKKNEVVSVNDNELNFVMKDINTKKTYKLSDEKGNGVVLNFWGSWCEPCKREMPFINKVYQEYKNKGIQLFALNADEPPFVVKKFVSDYGLTFPVGIDKDQDILDMYGVEPLPTTFFISPNGKIKRIVTGQMTEEKFRGYIHEILPKS
jgi:thiol-disulfide isomerase/thioredoxin